MTSSLFLNVNGTRIAVTPERPGVSLLDVLRTELELYSARLGCGLGKCGSCTVLIDGVSVRSCLIPIDTLSPDQKILTQEGLARSGRPDPVRQAFRDDPVFECGNGSCSNGMIMEAVSLLNRNPTPSPAQIRDALETVLCRCGKLDRAIRAVRRAIPAKP